MHPIHKHMSSRMKARKADERYDAKMAYDKNLSGKARLHYLENDIADKGMSMKAPMDMKSAMEMKAPMNMGHEAPSMKAPMNKAGKKAGKAAMDAAAMIPGMGAAGIAAKAVGKAKKDKAGKAAAAGAAVGAAMPGKGKKKKSPADMKAPMRKESAKQERKNLMKDNPVDKDATGKRPGTGARNIPAPKPGRRVDPKKPSKRKPKLEDFIEKKGTGRRYGG